MSLLAPVPSAHVFSGGPHIMGVVNVTPDSFSDGGRYVDPEKAIAHGLKLAAEGAHILDVGGESTRPGAIPVSAAEEIERVVPVIRGLAGKVKWLSVDTRHAATMEAALVAGANAINDISALSHDERSIFIARDAGVPIFFMHMQGDPQRMQKNPIYNNVIEDVFDYLLERKTIFEATRIDMNLLICDPGIGFGKTVEHNLLLLRNIKKFHDIGLPVMLGASRKSFIAKLSRDEPSDERLAGSLSAALWALSQGVQIYRVHDVKETVQAFKIYQSIFSSPL
jgi:dihydropteroate synthase